MQKKRDSLSRCRFSSKSFGGKRGQVTVFIILGILMLLALILVVVLEKEIVVFKPGELIPTEKGKVENYITACIDEIGGDALFLVGLQGGYLEVPPDILIDNFQHLKLGPDQVVPYWARGETVRIPPLSSIKEDIDDYMEENLRECVMGAEVFTESYNIIEKSGIEANTEIVDKKVIFNVRWDLEVRDKAGEIISEVIDHVAESEVKLKWAYETAKTIIETEMREMKFEDITVDLIALEHPDVPLTGIEVECGKKKWDANKVKETLQDMLRVNVREMKVEGTSFVEFPKELPYYQNHYVWNIGVDNSQIGVNFIYSNNFPFYFEVTPREGNMMKSGMVGGSDLLSKICIQQWKFTYDVSYPVSVEVRDETTDYIFRTAFTVHVKRNRADRSGEILMPTAQQLDFTGSDEFCSRREIPVTVYTYDLIENAESGVYWREPLEDVSLSYTCLKYKCEVGKTEYGFGGLGHVAAYRTNFPYCAGGILRGEKEGYREGWEYVVANKLREVELNMIPVLEVPAEKIKVVKHSLGEVIGKGKVMDDGEVASIKIKRDKEESGLHESSMILSSDLDEEMLVESKLEFLAGTDFEYELEIYVMDEEGVEGGYMGNWTVDWNELKLGGELIFHVLSKESFGETELFDFIGSLEEHSWANKLFLEPEIE